MPDATDAHELARAAENNIAMRKKMMPIGRGLSFHCHAPHLLYFSLLAHKHERPPSHAADAIDYSHD